MTTDLDKLDRLREQSTGGCGWITVHVTNLMTGRTSYGIRGIGAQATNMREPVADYVVALHNAYPALSAELRAARALIDVLLQAPEWERENTTHYWEEPQCQFCSATERAGHYEDCPRQVALAEWQKARGEG